MSEFWWKSLILEPQSWHVFILSFCTQNQNMLRLKERLFFCGNCNVLTFSVSDSARHALWRKCVYSFWHWQREETITCEGFLQFGCSQVSSDEPGDELITQSRHFIDPFIYSTTQYLLDAYHLSTTRKLIISANSHINFIRLISHFADGKTEQQGHKVIFWIFELDIDKSSRWKTGVAK